jgi:hypothetical protein
VSVIDFFEKWLPPCSCVHNLIRNVLCSEGHYSSIDCISSIIVSLQESKSYLHSDTNLLKRLELAMDYLEPNVAELCLDCSR